MSVPPLFWEPVPGSIGMDCCLSRKIAHGDLVARFPQQPKKLPETKVKFEPISISPEEDELTALLIAHFNSALDDLSVVEEFGVDGGASLTERTDAEQNVLKAKAKLPAAFRESLVEITQARLQGLLRLEGYLKDRLDASPPPQPGQGGALPPLFPQAYLRIRFERREVEIQLFAMQRDVRNPQ
jgi:hypothetical protein